MIQNIDDIQIQFNSDNLFVVNITLALVMFGVALDIKTSDFKKLLESPKPVIIGIISQFILIPLTTFILVILTKPHPSIALGMFIVAACPGGNISNFYTKLSKGNAALSVSLTAFASMASLIMTPLNFTLWGNLYEPTATLLKQVSLSPVEVAKFILLILAIPLFIGMTINYYYQKIAHKLSKILKPLSILIFLSFIFGAFANNFDIFTEHIHYVIFLVALQNGALFIIGYYFAKINKLSFKDQKTLSIETGIQNAGVGLMLVFSFFNGLGGMALFVAFWAVWDILSGMILSFYWSKKEPKTISS